MNTNLNNRPSRRRAVVVAAAAAAVLAGGGAAAFSTLAGPASASFDAASASFSDNHRGPAVLSFSANHPTCKAGAAVATLKLTWRTTGADGATIAVDGLGEYGEYGASSSLKLNIPCDGAAHTYNVWPNGHQDARRTLTVTPKFEHTHSSDTDANGNGDTASV